MRHKVMYLGLSFAMAFAVGCGGQTDPSNGETEEDLANDPANAVTDAEMAQVVASAGQLPVEAEPAASICSWACDAGLGVGVCGLVGSASGGWSGAACGVGSIGFCNAVCSRAAARPLPWPAGKACLTRLGFGWPTFKKDMPSATGQDVRVYTVHWGFTGQWGTAVVIRNYERPAPIWVSYDIEHGGHHKKGWAQYHC